MTKIFRRFFDNRIRKKEYWKISKIISKSSNNFQNRSIPVPFEKTNIRFTRKFIYISTISTLKIIKKKKKNTSPFRFRSKARTKRKTTSIRIWRSATLNLTEGRDRRLKSVHLMYVDGDQAYRPVCCVEGHDASCPVKPPSHKAMSWGTNVPN